MKLKYKKIILMVSLGTMFIGCVTLSMSQSHSKNKKADMIQVTENANILEEDFKSQTFQSDSGEMVLEKDKYPEVNELVEKYYSAILSCDMDALKTMVTNVETISETDLKQQSQVIQGYKNFECYTIKGKKEGSYFVFVYNEVKLTGIETLAPGLTRLYLEKDDKGKLRIYKGAMDSETQKLSDAVNECEGVKRLISATNTRYLEAMQSDQELYEFYQDAEEQAKK